MSEQGPRADGSSFLVVDGVARQYGDLSALAPCSFGLAAGQVLGLAGPNGAGKTTFARMATGFLAQSSGTMTVGGLTPIDYRHAFGVGYLPEELTAFGNWTVLDLLRLRESVGPVRLDLGLVSEILELAPYRHRALQDLSKGQRRLAFAAYAMTGPPGLVVLDEPDSGLDPSALERLHALVVACAASGSTVIVLSHLLQETAQLCDWFAILDRGRILGWYDRRTVSQSDVRTLYREIVKG